MPLDHFDISVILPTYNEAENIAKIIPIIANTLSNAQLNAEIIVMDDHSPDGTAQAAQALAPLYPVKAVDRQGKPRGLSAAVLDGFERATGTVVAVMDADMSHPVETLPAMVNAILNDHIDICVGSRNISGGGTLSWPWYRRLISGTAAWLTFGITPMTDPTSGYMAIRRSLLDFGRYNPIGWKIVLEIVAKHPSAALKEFPIVFQDRQFGSSKMSLKEQTRYIQHLLRLYDEKWPLFSEFVRFGIVGLSGVIVDLLGSATTLWLISTGLSHQFQASWATREISLIASATIGFSLALSSNYFLNRRWSFRHGKELPLGRSYFRYLLVNGVGLWLRLAIISIFGFFFSSASTLQFVNVLGIMVASAFNFVGIKFWAFKK